MSNNRCLNSATRCLLLLQEQEKRGVAEGGVVSLTPPARNTTSPPTGGGRTRRATSMRQGTERRPRGARRRSPRPWRVATRAPPSRSAAETRPRKSNQSSSRRKPSVCMDGPPASAPATSRRRPAKAKRGPSDQRPTGPRPSPSFCACAPPRAAGVGWVLNLGGERRASVSLPSSSKNYWYIHMYIFANIANFTKHRQYVSHDASSSHCISCRNT